MIARPHAVSYTFGEYLAHDEASNTKHEFLDGQIYARAGGTPEHSALIASVATALAMATRGGSCRVHVSELRILARETGLATYPDVSVVCGPWDRAPEDARTILNPALIVEVLSPSTEAYDRGEKLEHYQQISSLRACILVAHDRRELEVWTRPAPDQSWTRTVVASGQAAQITQPPAVLDVDALYEMAAEPTA